MTMRRTVVTLSLGIALGMVIPLSAGGWIAGHLFTLGSRFAAAGIAPVYSVSVGTAYEQGGGPVLRQAKAGRR